MYCIDCGLPVDPSKSGVYREVSGWEKVRMHGGANSVTLRKETGRLMCSGCGERRKLDARRGVVSGQTTLI
jgi:hypothetical protein